MPSSHYNKNHWMKQGVKGQIESITHESLRLSGSEPPVSSEDGYEQICSYTWVKQEIPTVHVPGGAPVYRPPDLPLTIVPGETPPNFSKNEMTLPDFPFEVLCQAVEVMNPHFKFDGIDIVVNRHSLRKFLKFCRGNTQEVFRVNLFVINNTLLIERCERSAGFLVRGAQDPGYGHLFERVVTELPAGVKDTYAHHNVLRYNFGGLQCAVRFEVDAYISTPSEDQPVPVDKADSLDRDDEIDRLARNINETKLNKGPSKSGSVIIIQKGDGTPQEKAAEIKCMGKKSQLSPIIPQLWFGRTSYLIRGRHDGKGTVNRIQFDDLRGELKEWEVVEKNQQTLQKLAILLSRLRDIVRATDKKSCVAIYNRTKGPPTLRVFHYESERGVLPPSAIQRFWTRPG